MGNVPPGNPLNATSIATGGATGDGDGDGVGVELGEATPLGDAVAAFPLATACPQPAHIKDATLSTTSPRIVGLRTRVTA